MHICFSVLCCLDGFLWGSSTNCLVFSLCHMFLGAVSSRWLSLLSLSLLHMFHSAMQLSLGGSTVDSRASSVECPLLTLETLVCKPRQYVFKYYVLTWLTFVQNTEHKGQNTEERRQICKDS